MMEATWRREKAVPLLAKAIVGGVLGLVWLAAVAGVAILVVSR